jgi:hypothetical protein
MVIALLAFSGAQDKSSAFRVNDGLALQPLTKQSTRPRAEPETTGRFEMKPGLVKLGPKPELRPIVVNGVMEDLILKPPCCPNPECCQLPPIPPVQEFAVFLSPQAEADAVLEVYLEISSRNHTPLFRTSAKCGGCGGSNVLRAGRKTTGYLLTLSADAFTAAGKYFVTGNRIKVYVRTRNRDNPALAYIVNAKALGQ